MFSGKARYAGMNIQIAASLEGEVPLSAPFLHGARHDAYAYEAPGLKSLLENVADKAADLGYVGVDGIDIVPFKRASGRDLNVSIHHGVGADGVASIHAVGVGGRPER
jgi:hypothetical protein